MNSRHLRKLSHFSIALVNYHIPQTIDCLTMYIFQYSPLYEAQRYLVVIHRVEVFLQICYLYATPQSEFQLHVWYIVVQVIHTNEREHKNACFVLYRQDNHWDWYFMKGQNILDHQWLHLYDQQIYIHKCLRISNITAKISTLIMAASIQLLIL